MEIEREVRTPHRVIGSETADLEGDARGAGWRIDPGRRGPEGGAAWQASGKKGMRRNGVSRPYRLAVIGCGRARGADSPTGFGMGHMHAQAYRETGRCELVAAVDVSPENAAVFAARWGSPAVYPDYRTMLAEARPEIVSVCTRAHLHAEMVIACAGAGVKAVHCEKPMATTWGDAQRMVKACEQAGTQLTINHQNRFREPHRVARDLVREGPIGELRSLQGTSSHLRNSHTLDLLFFYNEERPAASVLAQIDTRCRRAGELEEEQAICSVRFAKGVHALLLTGPDVEIGCVHRLIGTDGIIEVHGRAPRVRIQRQRDAAWRSIDVPDGPDWQPPLDRAIADVIAALDESREPELSARWALQATEVIFAASESSRRRGRVDLPLTIEEPP
jgi:UDP-N-acetylglucosamine 3-dehydrogenase